MIFLWFPHDFPMVCQANGPSCWWSSQSLGFQSNSGWIGDSKHKSRAVWDDSNLPMIQWSYRGLNMLNHQKLWRFHMISSWIPVGITQFRCNPYVAPRRNQKLPKYITVHSTDHSTYIIYYITYKSEGVANLDPIMKISWCYDPCQRSSQRGWRILIPQQDKVMLLVSSTYKSEGVPIFDPLGR